MAKKPLFLFKRSALWALGGAPHGPGQRIYRRPWIGGGTGPTPSPGGDACITPGSDVLIRGYRDPNHASGGLGSLSPTAYRGLTIWEFTGDIGTSLNVIDFDDGSLTGGKQLPMNTVEFTINFLDDSPDGGDYLFRWNNTNLRYELTDSDFTGHLISSLGVETCYTYGEFPENLLLSVPPGTWINDGEWVDDLNNRTASITVASSSQNLYQNITPSLTLGNNYELVANIEAYSAGSYRMLVASSQTGNLQGAVLRRELVEMISTGSISGIQARAGATLTVDVMSMAIYDKGPALAAQVNFGDEVVTHEGEIVTHT